MAKEIFKCYYISNLEMGRLFWIIWVSPMQSSGSLYEETEQELTTDRGSDMTEGEQQGERDLKRLCC